MVLAADTVSLAVVIENHSGDRLRGTASIGSLEGYQLTGRYAPPVVYLALTHISADRADFVGEIHQGDLIQGHMSIAQMASGLVWFVASYLRTGLVSLLAASIVGCGDAVAPSVGRIEIDPPPLYRTFWQSVELCSGRVGRFEAVRWFVAYELERGSGIVAQRRSQHEITVRSDLWLETNVVRHEVLHELLDGDPSHENPSWEACDVEVGLPLGLYPHGD